MTGKEALKKTREWLTISQSMTNPTDVYPIISALYDKIEKDLEVLDILKEHFHIEKDFEWQEGLWYIDMQKSDFDFKSVCTEEEWNNSPQKKIKDWLMRKENQNE